MADLILEVNNFGCKRNKTDIINGCSFSLERGQMCVICGPNGAGKSTLMTSIAGIYESGLEIGEGIIFEGKPLKSYKRKSLSRKIAYLTQQENFIWSSSVKDIVLTGRYAHTGVSGIYSKHDFMVAEEAIKRVQIESLAEKDILNLSGGEIQKVRIARCICQEPDLLLLDEPVANLDFSYELEILNIIKEIAVEKNMAILVSIHDLNLAARVADKLILMPKLKPCFFGRPEDILTPELLKSVYGCDFGLFTHPQYGKTQVFVK